LQNSQCSIDLAASSAVASGNNLTLNLAISFTPTFAGTKNIYMSVLNKFGLNSGWVSRGTWTATNAPIPVSVTPSAGTGAAQTFQYSFSDPNGFRDVKTMWTQISTGTAYPGSCATMYDAVNNRLYLIQDGGTGWLGPIAPGAATTLQNSQCAIDGATSSVVGSGNNVTVTLSYTFQPTYTGAKNIYGRAMNLAGLDSGWQLKGVWIP